MAIEQYGIFNTAEEYLHLIGKYNYLSQVDYFDQILKIEIKEVNRNCRFTLQQRDILGMLPYNIYGREYTELAKQEKKIVDEKAYQIVEQWLKKGMLDLKMDEKGHPIIENGIMVHRETYASEKMPCLYTIRKYICNFYLRLGKMRRKINHIIRTNEPKCKADEMVKLLTNSSKSYYKGRKIPLNTIASLEVGIIDDEMKHYLIYEKGHDKDIVCKVMELEKSPMSIYSAVTGDLQCKVIDNDVYLGNVKYFEDAHIKLVKTGNHKDYSNRTHLTETESSLFKVNAQWNDEQRSYLITNQFKKNYCNSILNVIRDMRGLKDERW